MHLHEDNTLFKQAIQATAQWLGEQGKDIPEIFIEKDYWVTIALRQIFHGKACAFAIFKGGTALSKCHRLIERFSEDIDIVVVREKDDNGSILKNKLKAISKSVGTILPEVEKIGITNKKGMIRKTVHRYPKTAMQGVYGQVGEDITVESSWLGTFEPHGRGQVSCYITEMMEATCQQSLIEIYKMQSFEVLVLSIDTAGNSKYPTLIKKIVYPYLYG